MPSLMVYWKATPTPHHSIFTGWMLFLSPNQLCQSTEGKHCNIQVILIVEIWHWFSTVMLSVCYCSWKTFCQWWSSMICCIRRQSLCLCPTSRAHPVRSRWLSRPFGFISARRHRMRDCRGQYHTLCLLTSSMKTARFFTTPRRSCFTVIIIIIILSPPAQSHRQEN